MSVTQEIAERKDTRLGGVLHAHCRGCYPSIKPGDQIKALCGATKVVRSLRMTPKPPPNACVVCVDLRHRCPNEDQHTT